jgi:hypothetical protein
MIVAALVGLVTLGGCLSNDEPLELRSTALAFSASDGKTYHRTLSLACRGEVELNLSARDFSAGVIDVTVAAGGEEIVYQHQLRPGNTVRGASLTGVSGSWKLTVDARDFAVENFAASLECMA